jgi:preprotein translocase subunit SecD
MIFKDLMREWRTWLLITALVGAFIAIGPHYKQVETAEGETQTALQTNINKGIDIQGGARVLLQPDLSGVNKTQHDQVIQSLKTTLENRMSQVNADTTTSLYSNKITGEQYVQVEMPGANQTQLTRLLTRQGKFEASFSARVNPGDTIQIGDETFPVGGTDDEITIDGKTLTKNRSTTLFADKHEVPVKLVNRTETAHLIYMQAFTGEDVKGVDIDTQSSRINQQGPNSYQFQFQVLISQDAAERFNAIAQNFGSDGSVGTGGTLPGTQLVLQLDGEQVSSLNVRTVFRDQVIDKPLITGGGNSLQEARQEKERLKTLLRSGSLPVPVNVISTNTVSATLGQQFMNTAIKAILLAVVGVGILIFLRYKNPKIAIPIMITGFSEVLIILALFSKVEVTPLAVTAIAIPTLIGLAAALRKGDPLGLMTPLGAAIVFAFMNLSQSLNLAAIAGIIAAVGTGVDDQIIITDERNEERVRSIKKRLKRAFFIIMVSAGSTIGAMFPLAVGNVGGGSVEAFAWTTIAGVIAGITITRPAYAKMIELMDLEDSELF